MENNSWYYSHFLKNPRFTPALSLPFLYLSPILTQIWSSQSPVWDRRVVSVSRRSEIITIYEAPPISAWIVSPIDPPASLSCFLRLIRCHRWFRRPSQRLLSPIRWRLRLAVAHDSISVARHLLLPWETNGISTWNSNSSPDSDDLCASCSPAASPTSPVTTAAPVASGCFGISFSF